MTQPTPSQAKKQLAKSQYPICARCQKAVDEANLLPPTQHPGEVMLQYSCHGEQASQEIQSRLLDSEQGLSDYTVFNAYTSGIMPGESLRQKH